MLLATNVVLLLFPPTIHSYKGVFEVVKGGHLHTSPCVCVSVCVCECVYIYIYN